MKSLILGGSVFVGKQMVQALVEAGHEVSVLNRGKTPAQLPEGVELIVADRTDKESMKAALTNTSWDAVFDISGFIMVAGGADAGSLIELLDGQVGDYVYTSSIMAYDQGSGVFPWREDAPSSTEGPVTYGGFKAVMENELLSQHKKTGFPVSIVRPAAIYGPNNNIYDMETPMFLRLEQGRPILIPHEGLVACSYGHVDDLCDAMIACVGNEKARGEIFNITAEGVTVNEYVKVLAEIVGETPNIVNVPAPVVSTLTQPAYGHLFGTAHHGVLGIDKAEKLLGVKPSYDFKSGHEHTYAWFKEQGWSGRTEPLADPMWMSSWNFDYESEIAAQIQAAS
ncbi:MAG: NAD-dependent epimerase/dehydratase family protein [Gammaproteobacteria bacterium]|jgi:nucleoside-diphosphate-sugar epimerase|nr:NAD-dependent epimerase/dehydratase family protein [Gammaproteobacteria bacterium]MBT4492121.1 NAD-dependent epimerase/dehydratase family protein [Gammaproteobacteria bacterium]MBT7371030.1 NAD-dependent epimerase/dehydratase family protein [Gammaproteobacteria bacterium]